MRNTSLTNMVGAACFAAMTLTACGGGTGGRDIIAHVGTREISKSSLEHLISIEAITDYEEFPNPTIPTSLVPEPPRYTGCVAHLQRIAPTAAAGRPRPTTVQLTRTCQQLRKALQTQALNALISSEWLSGEADQLGVKITAEEVSRQFARYKTERFPRRGEYERYLAGTNETPADQLFRIRNDMLASSITHAQEALAGGGGKHETPAAFQSSFTATWKAKTTCRLGYIVESCKEYKQPTRPEQTYNQLVQRFVTTGT